MTTLAPTSRDHLTKALRAVEVARLCQSYGDDDARVWWDVAAMMLRRAIGAFNSERNRKGAGLALLALAKVRAELVA